MCCAARRAALLKSNGAVRVVVFNGHEQVCQTQVLTREEILLSAISERDTSQPTACSAARRNDRSKGSEAELRNFFIFAWTSILTELVPNSFENLARPRAVSSVARVKHAPQNTRGTALSIVARGECSMPQGTAFNILKTGSRCDIREHNNLCPPMHTRSGKQLDGEEICYIPVFRYIFPPAQL